jgi:hypothetical protein
MDSCDNDTLDKMTTDDSFTAAQSDLNEKEMIEIRLNIKEMQVESQELNSNISWDLPPPSCLYFIPVQRNFL